MKIEVANLSKLETDVFERIVDCIDTPHDLKRFMEQVVGYGAASGMITSLIYKEDIIKFLENNFVEVMETFQTMIEQDYLECIPADISVMGWMVAEYVTAQIYNMIDWERFFNELPTIEAELMEEE